MLQDYHAKYRAYLKSLFNLVGFRCNQKPQYKELWIIHMFLKLFKVSSLEDYKKMQEIPAAVSAHVLYNSQKSQNWWMSGKSKLRAKSKALIVKNYLLSCFCLRTNLWALCMVGTQTKTPLGVTNDKMFMVHNTFCQQVEYSCCPTLWHCISCHQPHDMAQYVVLMSLQPRIIKTISCLENAK